ncbi:hypothetical protein EMCRGX_G004469 [Ephydatia muelleri]
MASVGTMQVVFINYDESYGRVCTAIGFLWLYTEWTKLLFTMWVTFHLFCFAVLHKNLKKLEVLYVVTSLLAPEVVVAVPLITHTYGLSTGGNTCYIYANTSVAFIERLALWDGPAMLMLIAASTAMVVMVTKLTSQVRRRSKYEPITDGDQFTKALKQLLPLAAFPLLFFIFEIPVFILHIYTIQYSAPNEGIVISAEICVSLWRKGLRQVFYLRDWKMLVKSTPKWLSYSSGFVVVTLFDQDVLKCFTSCTGVHPSIAAWKQAQLSLSRGGLGLHSLSHHAPAAFIASLCFSGLDSISHVHLLQSLEIFNSSVHQSDNIQIGSVLEKLPSQKTLSSILDDNLFRVLQGSLSIADRARLLSASSPHASSWLTVTPSEGQGLHLDPPVFQTALKWWLGLDTAEGSICALCPDKMLDPLGHHATTCKRGGDVVFRHNKLRDILAETCRRAHLSVQVEAGCNLTPDHSHSRPADVLISNWVLGKTAACDISVTSPLNSNIMSEAGVTAGAAAQASELRKHEANDVKCSELGWLCIPLVVESYGAWGKEAMESFSSLASRLAITSSRPKSAVLSELYGRLNLNLVRANVRAIMSRYCPLNSF